MTIPPGRRDITRHRKRGHEDRRSRRRPRWQAPDNRVRPGYTASKSAIAGLTKALANEWTSRGVTVNAIAPGYIATDNTQALQDDPERSRSILERIPAARWGAASDLGGRGIPGQPRLDYVSLCLRRLQQRHRDP
jgi:NAD(P)-dependent dehydrogenase (short-subunit alcohol dehydrogenase family)